MFDLILDIVIVIGIALFVPTLGLSETNNPPQAGGSPKSKGDLDDLLNMDWKYKGVD